ncbi:MAG: T9SS type A sorting domain-containing protein [Bacteroidota bacterium]
MKIVIFFFLCLSCNVLLAQAPQKFYMRFGGNGYDVGYDVKQTLDNGYIITGSTSSFGQGNTDMYLIKLDSVGHKKFETSFGNYNNEIGKSVVQLLDSSYVVVGYTNSIGFGGYDIFLVKTDKNGNLLWQKTIGGTDWDFAYSMQTTSDGGFIIAGTTYSYGYGNADGYVIKTDASGNTIWTKTYGGANDDEFKSVIQTADGGYALTGYTKSHNDVNGDSWLFKLNTSGDSVKSFSYNFGKFDSYNDIKELSTGEYLIGGAVTFTNTQNMDGIFAKINTSGQVLLQVFEGQAGSDEQIYKVNVSNSSFGTYTFLCNSHENGSAFQNQIKLLLIDAGGGYVNGGSIGSSFDDECYSFCLTKESSKGYAAIGYTDSYNSILSDFFFIKYDSLLSIGTNITSLKETNLIKKVNVFPNPFSEKIYFENIESIDIYTLQGDMVYYNSKINSNSLDLGFLSAGTYIISVTNKSHYKFSQKLIKINTDD